VSPSTDRAGPGLPWRSFNVLVVAPTPSHPQDHGNRKRIYEICRELQRQGARIHYLHYPAEFDWRYERPRRWEREMRAAWDDYQLVAPSRPLHEPAAGEDHTIDEWADPGVGHTIAWMCRSERIDLVIVNYTWMSFCFDYVPRGIFKVCDTHDVFGTRRQMLEAGGIAPEFFHTTREEEAKGLARADLVWAIKPGEQKYFEDELGLKNCLTMLHAEPERGWWQGPPSADGWLRAGFLGAKNNVNRRNIETFLAAALPLIQSYMAPVKIVIAGSCSEDFLEWDHPNVEVRGRVDEIADFYRSVDLVITPVEFSTGLKIKVSEALSSGAPVIAHRHAMEGYPAEQPLHLLPDFKSIAKELIKLSFDRGGLAALAASSHAVCVDIRRSVLAALEETRRQAVARGANTLCIVTPMAALDEDNLLYDHLHSVLDHLRFAAPLALYVVGPPATPDPDLLRRFDERIAVFASPALMDELGAEAPDNWTAIGLAELLEVRGWHSAYFLCDVRAELQPGRGNLRRAFVRHDAIAISGGDADRLIDALRARTTVAILAADTRQLMAWRPQYGVADIVQITFRRNGAFQSLARRAAKRPAKRRYIIALGAAGDPLIDGIAALAERLGADTRRLDPDDPDTARRLCGGGLNEPPPGLAGAALVLDLTQGGGLGAILHEAAQRARIPLVRLLRGSSAAILHHRQTSPIFASSIGRLFDVVAHCLTDAEYLKTVRELNDGDLAARSAGDAGWTWLWHSIGGRQLKAEPATATAGLFGGLTGGAAAIIRDRASGVSCDAVQLNQHYADGADYEHLDLTLYRLQAAGEAWAALRFKVARTRRGPHIEFRRRIDWPEVFAQWPGLESDEFGPRFTITENEADCRRLAVRLGEPDRNLIQSLLQLLPTIIGRVARVEIPDAHKRWAEIALDLQRLRPSFQMPEGGEAAIAANAAPVEPTPPAPLADDDFLDGIELTAAGE
jgi:glycosyltransferase involved in cell wall biosynthesis